MPRLRRNSPLFSSSTFTVSLFRFKSIWSVYFECTVGARDRILSFPRTALGGPVNGLPDISFRGALCEPQNTSAEISGLGEEHEWSGEESGARDLLLYTSASSPVSPGHLPATRLAGFPPSLNLSVLSGSEGSASRLPRSRHACGVKRRIFPPRDSGGPQRRPPGPGGAGPDWGPGRCSATLISATLPAGFQLTFQRPPGTPPPPTLRLPGRTAHPPRHAPRHAPVRPLPRTTPLPAVARRALPPATPPARSSPHPFSRPPLTATRQLWTNTALALVAVRRAARDPGRISAGERVALRLLAAKRARNLLGWVPRGRAAQRRRGRPRRAPALGCSPRDWLSTHGLAEPSRQPQSPGCDQGHRVSPEPARGVSQALPDLGGQTDPFREFLASGVWFSLGIYDLIDVPLR